MTASSRSEAAAPVGEVPEGRAKRGKHAHCDEYPTTAGAEYVERVIRPGRSGTVDWGEIWRYRELLYFLTWRDVKIRYKQTALGAAWAVLQPVLTTFVFTLFFGSMAGLSHRTGGVPYPLLVLAAQVPWFFFQNAVSNSSNSLVGSTNLITKVYFPRLIIPFASIAAGLVDFAVSAGVLLLAILAYPGQPVDITWQLALLPLFLAGTLLVAAGVGTLLSALTVAYRDFRYVVPFTLQIWMFISGVIYPPSIVPESWQTVYYLNPLAGIIDGFRAAFLGTPIRPLHALISLSVSFLLFIGGCAYFRRVERSFADII